MRVTRLENEASEEGCRAPATFALESLKTDCAIHMELASDSSENMDKGTLAGSCRWTAAKRVNVHDRAFEEKLQRPVSLTVACGT